MDAQYLYYHRPDKSCWHTKHEHCSTTAHLWRPSVRPAGAVLVISGHILNNVTFVAAVAYFYEKEQH
jgi:hypothetical protein